MYEDKNNDRIRPLFFGSETGRFAIRNRRYAPLWKTFGFSNTFPPQEKTPVFSLSLFESQSLHNNKINTYSQVGIYFIVPRLGFEPR